jgi:hypothetical protein
MRLLVAETQDEPAGDNFSLGPDLGQLDDRFTIYDRAEDWLSQNLDVAEQCALRLLLAPLAPQAGGKIDEQSDKVVVLADNVLPLRAKVELLQGLWDALVDAVARPPEFGPPDLTPRPVHFA